MLDLLLCLPHPHALHQLGDLGHSCTVLLVHYAQARPHRPHEDEEEQWEDAEECPHVEVGDVGDLSVRNFAFLLHKEIRRDNLRNLILEADVEGVDCEQDDQHRSRLRRTDLMSKNSTTRITSLCARIEMLKSQSRKKINMVGA